MGEVVQLRDFKRKEENDAALVRLAKEVMGLIDVTDTIRAIGRDGYDTAPCELPPVQPMYEAPG